MTCVLGRVDLYVDNLREVLFAPLFSKISPSTLYDLHIVNCYAKCLKDNIKILHIER